MKRRIRGSGRILKIGRVWKIRYTLGGHRIQETAGPRQKDAVALLHTRLGQMADGRLTVAAATLTWADIESIILDEHRQMPSYDKVERHVRRHLRRHFAGERGSKLTYARLLSYKKARFEEHASASTVRYELSLVRTGLVVAQKKGELAVLPPIPEVYVSNTRTSFIDGDDWDRLDGNLTGQPKQVARFMYWTGWRREEATTREWRHVDWERKTIELEPGETKNGEGRPFPFGELPELDAVLKEQLAYTRTVERRTGQVVRWVFHRNGRQVKSIRSAWWTACDKAGLPRDTRPHDFRRTVVRRLERAGVSRSVAKKLVGHLTDSIYSRYAITNEGDLREGLAKVRVLLAGSPRRSQDRKGGRA